MRTRSGPLTLLAAGTPATSAAPAALEPIELSGNKVKLFVTTVTGGAGTLTITAETSWDGTTYHDVIDRNSVWSTSTSVIDTAGTYDFDLTGLPLDDGGFLRLSYYCTNAAGTIAITAVNYVDPGGSSSVETGDIIADLSTTNTLLTAGNVDLAALEVLSTAANVDLAAMEVLQTSIDGKLPALGTAAMAASSPVTLATDDTVMAAINALITAGNVDLAALEVLATSIDADTSSLAGTVTGGTTSQRVEEIDPLSAQYGTVDVISDEAVATALDTTTAWQPVGGYGPLSLQIYLLGGVGAASANRTVTLTVEATNGGTVAAATDAIDITESCKSLLTGVDSAANYTSTGATAYRDILTLRREDANFTHYRVAYAWDDAPSVTAGAIVVTARNAAI